MKIASFQKKVEGDQMQDTMWASYARNTEKRQNTLTE